MFEKLELVQKRYDELSQLLAQAEIATNPRRLQELSKEKAGLEDIVGMYQQYKAKGKELAELEALLDSHAEVEMMALVKWMKQFAQVIYVVKPSPVQDDLTLEDVRRSGLESEFGKVISTGIASPGIVFSLASAQFKREFESADLIFAKGMGHYEALSELPAEGKFFYCLKAKCQPVADSLGVPLNSYVAMLR